MPVNPAPPASSRRSGAPREDDRDLIDAVLSASRALVAVAARSLASCENEITLPQYRVLVILCARGAQRVADLAEALDVLPSTATRMCDRLAAKRLIGRSRSAHDRRIVNVTVTPAGRELVDRVSDARRKELRKVLAQIPPAGRPAVVEALRAFSVAAGEVPEDGWALGWGQ